MIAGELLAAVFIFAMAGLTLGGIVAALVLLSEREDRRRPTYRRGRRVRRVRIDRIEDRLASLEGRVDWMPTLNDLEKAARELRFPSQDEVDALRTSVGKVSRESAERWSNLRAELHAALERVGAQLARHGNALQALTSEAELQAMAEPLAGGDRQPHDGADPELAERAEQLAQVEAELADRSEVELAASRAQGLPFVDVTGRGHPTRGAAVEVNRVVSHVYGGDVAAFIAERDAGHPRARTLAERTKVTTMAVDPAEGES